MATEKTWKYMVNEAIGLEPMEIKIKKLSENAVIPKYAIDGDVGMDLTALDVESDEETDMYLYHTGISIESPNHYGVLIFPRSSNRKTDAYICNHVPVIDTAVYRGEIMICFKNRDSLKQIGLKAEMDELLNSLQVYKDQSDVVHKAYMAYDEATKNPMKYAPYEVGDRICQMVLIPYPNVLFKEVGELSETERGEKGFGSTGK